MKQVSWCAMCALLALGSSFGLTGCGGDDEPQETGLTCGDGSVEQGGKCVGSVNCGEGTAAKDGKCLPDAQVLKCGEGTVEKEGSCVPASQMNVVECGAGTVLDAASNACLVDPNATMEDPLPGVEKVILQELTIFDDGKLPIMVDHPFEASMTVKVEGAEPFSTIAVLRLESADGTKACNTGFFNIDYKGENGEDEAPGVITAVETFYTQSSCAALDGLTDVKAQIVFDPFGRTEWNERTLPNLEDDSIDDAMGQELLMKAGILDQAACKPGAGSSHPDTCTTELEVKASAGKDIVLREMQLSSPIAVLPFFDTSDDDSPDTKGTFVDPNSGETVDFRGKDEIESRGTLSQDPQFAVNASVLVYGQGDKMEEEIEDVELSFFLRPALTGVEAERTEDFDWAPLTAQYYEVKKAGDKPTLVELERDFLDSIAGPVEMQKDSPIYISDFTDGTGKAQNIRTRVLEGAWSGFDRFEIKVCAGLDSITEGGREADAMANNCQTQEVVVLREAAQTVDTFLDQQTQVAGRTTWAKPWEKTWGSSLKLKLYAGPDINADKDRLFVGAKAGSKLSGFFDFTLFEAGTNGQDWWTQNKDKYEAYVTLFGVRLVNHGKPLPDGTITHTGAFNGFGGSANNPLEISKTFAKSKTICKVICIYVEGNLTLAAGLDISLTKEGTTGEYASAPASNGTTKYKRYTDLATYSQAKQRCRAKGGTLAEPRDDASFNAIASTNPNGWSWVAARSRRGSCKARQNRLNNARNSAASRWFGGDQARLDRNIQRCRGVRSPFSPRFFACARYRGAFRDIDRYTQEASGCSEAAFKADNNWVLEGNNKGQLITGKWYPGEPNDHGAGESHVGLAKWGANPGLNDFPVTARGNYVCEYNPGSSLTVTLEPYAKAEVGLYGGISLIAVRGGAFVKADILKLSLPLTGGLKYQLDSPVNKIYLTPILNVNLKLSTLNGSVGLWMQNWEVGWIYARWSGKRELPIYSWDGIEIGNWTLWELNAPTATISF